MQWAVIPVHNNSSRALNDSEMPSEPPEEECIESRLSHCKNCWIVPNSLETDHPTFGVRSWLVCQSRLFIRTPFLQHFCVDWSVLCSHRTVFRKGEPHWTSYTQLTLRVQGPGVTGTEHLLWISCKGRGVAGSSGLKWRPLICRCWARLTRDTETVCELCAVGCY